MLNMIRSFFITRMLRLAEFGGLEYLENEFLHLVHDNIYKFEFCLSFCFCFFFVFMVICACVSWNLFFFGPRNIDLEILINLLYYKCM